MHGNKIYNYHHNLAPACTYKCQCGRHVMNPRKARFTELVHMTGRYQVYVCHIWSTALPGFCSAPGRFRPGLSVYPFGFSDRKPADSRLGPAKVIFRGNDGYSGRVRHHTLKPVSQALKDPGNRLV
jgi:hypothetical protein